MQIVTTHKNTDFDALASVIAAKILYPDAIPVLPKPINANVKAFLSLHKDLFKIYHFDEINLDDIKSLIVVDANNWRRLDRIDKLRQLENLEIILWDHHLNAGNIRATWSCQAEMGANITLMVRQLKAEKKIITPIQATLFLAGLYEDTGNLTFPSVKAEDAYAAAYLLERKADLNVLNTFLRPAYGKKQKNTLFEMLRSPKKLNINGHSISISPVHIEGHVDGLAVVVNMYREILDVDAAFGVFTSQDRDRIIVIGRSNVDGLHIGSIMQRMGGGGHSGAGSAMLHSVAPDAVEEMIKNIIQGDQQASVKISDLMSFPVFTVSSDTSMKEVSLNLREKGCTGIPVVDGEKNVGIISRRDFRKIRKESDLNSPVKAYMSINVKSIEPGKSPAQAAALMVKHDIGRLPVVENGRIIGIVTR
ncbi:MAG: CBS domain-containing protein, partial [Proteobacteria bacterium]|nr:CBS domain-containing protein [Pseudomonadota bacterium]